MLRIGQGYDAHRLVENENLVLGGVRIPHHAGVKGHSDADVLVHAIIDALLGALALGDIGNWFPDTDPGFKGADSLRLLKKVLDDEKISPWRLVNLDSVIIAQKPPIAPHIREMRRRISDVFNTEFDRVSVKATTTEKMGFCGREEGIAASAVLILENTPHS